MSVLLCHSTGNPNSRNAAAAFHERGELSVFVVAAGLVRHQAPWKWLPARALAKLGRRDFSEAGTVASVAPLREAARLLITRFGGTACLGAESAWASAYALSQAVDRGAARCLSSPQLDSVYGYEDVAEVLFQAAQSRGLRRVYELPIGYWRHQLPIRAKECARRPDWAWTWRESAQSAEKLRRKDAELRLADEFVVASRFAAEGLREFLPPEAKVHVVPYGCPAPIRAEQRIWSRNGPLKLLFVGSLSQRKGLGDLLDVVQRLGTTVELSLIGHGHAADHIRQHFPQVRVMGSQPHHEVLSQMRQHDVFVFPSLYEGFGLVIAEAMSQGMAVVASDRTGLREIADPAAGLEVPAGDLTALESALIPFLQDRSKAEAMGRQALVQASRWQWRDYRQLLADKILGPPIVRDES